jgi:prepilin-type N-terminal cleavage/methylation domain-containing protein
MKRSAQSGFALIELPAALVVLGLFIAGAVYLFNNQLPWYVYTLIVVGPLLLLFGPMFIMDLIAQLTSRDRH